MKTVKDLNVENKKVIVRCDLNVPIEKGEITDDNRILESLPTLKYLIGEGAKVIILAHLGRVKSEEDKAKHDLSIVATKLSKYLDKEVKFVNKTRGVEAEVNAMDSGDIIMLQNTRHEDYPEKLESKNEPGLGSYWASLADVFINDAFGTAHREHASNVGIASNIGEKAVGFLIEKELEVLEKAINNPERPFTVILGGAKVKDKIGVIENLVNIADKVIISGGMTYTFLKAKGLEIGTSLLDEASLDFCKEMLEKYSDKILLPVDIHCADEFDPNSKSRIKRINEIEKEEMGMDIGPETIKMFEEVLSESNTVIWNGPCGVFEFDKFSTGTKEVLRILSEVEGTVIIGGGDSGAAAIQFGYKDSFTRISTGGGATLTMLEGKELPGVKSIEE
jgi:phosphoglycerate kinase